MDMTYHEIYELIAQGKWSIMDEERFLSSHNLKALRGLKVEMLLLPHMLDPVKKELFADPHAKKRFKAFKNNLDRHLHLKEKQYLMSIKGLSDKTKQIIRNAPWLSESSSLDLPLDEIPPKELALLNGTMQENRQKEVQSKPGRKIDHKAASQDYIEKEVEKLVQKEGRYTKKDGTPKPTTIRDELIKHSNISLGARQLFDRVKKALQKMQ